MIRKIFITSLKFFFVLILSAVPALYVSLHGYIPQVVDLEDNEYQRILGLRPTSGDVWADSFGFKDAFYYYRLNLSQADFNATGISQLHRMDSAESESLRRGRDTPVWWNPPPEAVSFDVPSHLQAKYFFYDTQRQVLFAICRF